MNLQSLYKTKTKKNVDLFPPFSERAIEAISLIDATPGYAPIAARLKRLDIQYSSSLPDRAQTSLRQKIKIGPTVFTVMLTINQQLVGLAGTLVHEEIHTRQNPFLKTVSFWSGLLTGAHPMASYEWPAYRAQTAYLRALAVSRPDLSPVVDLEIDAIISAVVEYYGKPPFEL